MCPSLLAEVLTGATPVAPEGTEDGLAWGADGAVVEFVDVDGAQVSFRLSRSGSVDYFVNGHLEVCNVDCYVSGLTLHLREASQSGAWTSSTRSTARTTAPSDAAVQRVMDLFQAQRKQAARRRQRTPTFEDDDSGDFEVLRTAVRPPGHVVQPPGQRTVSWEDEPGALQLDEEQRSFVTPDTAPGAGHELPGCADSSREVPGMHQLVPRSLAKSFSQISLAEPPTPVISKAEAPGELGTPMPEPLDMADILARADPSARRKRLVAAKRPAGSRLAGEVATPGPSTLALTPAPVPYSGPVLGESSSDQEPEAAPPAETSLAPQWAASLAARLAAPIACALRRSSR